MKKSILALLLAVLMVASLLPAAAMADGKVAEVNGEQYDTLAEAISQATERDTVYLLKNYTITAEQQIDKGITLNLGGNTLTMTGTTYAVGLKFTSGNSKITNGKVVDERSKGNTSLGFITAVVTGAASLITSNVEFYSYQPNGYSAGKQYYNYILQAQATSSESYGTLTLDAGTVIGEYERTDTATTSYGVVGVTVLGAYSSGNNVPKNYTGETLIVNSGVTINTTGFAICGNGTKHGTTTAINGGSITSKESTGLYYPQYGVLNVNGGSITGGGTGSENRSA